MLVPSSARCYRGDDGSLLIINDREVLFSQDGENFYELQGGSGRFVGDYMKVQYADRRDGTEYEIEHNATRVNGQLYTPTATPSEINFVPLPSIRKPEYLFFGPDGTVIFVSADMHHYSYESFRFFIGSLQELHEVPIRDVQRYRDGGTTYIFTDEGSLFSPTPMNREAVATWAPNEGERIELKQVKNAEAFEIREDENVAVVGRPDIAFVAE